MARPKDKSQLLSQMEQSFSALTAEVDELPLESRIAPGACEAWSVKDLLAHLDAWHEMFLVWEETGAAGDKPDMPAPGFTWKDTPALNEAIFRRTRDDSYSDVVARLGDSYQRVRRILGGYDPEDLATKRRFAWTGSTSVLSYAVSATSSHYEWARKLIRAHSKSF